MLYQECQGHLVALETPNMYLVWYRKPETEGPDSPSEIVATIVHLVRSTFESVTSK